jgi:hypothetical protein
MATRRIGRDARLWPWFAGWAVAGAGFCLCLLVILSVGWFALSLPVIAVILLANYGPSPRAATGLLSGAGIPLLYVAYLNRSGPGEVCKSAGGGFSCTSEWNPLLVLIPAVLLIVAGGVAFSLARRRPRRTSLR